MERSGSKSTQSSSQIKTSLSKTSRKFPSSTASSMKPPESFFFLRSLRKRCRLRYRHWRCASEQGCVPNAGMDQNILQC